MALYAGLHSLLMEYVGLLLHFETLHTAQTHSWSICHLDTITVAHVFMATFLYTTDLWTAGLGYLQILVHSKIAPSVYKIQRSRRYSVYQVISPVTLLCMCCAVALFSDPSQHTHSWLTPPHLCLLLHISTGLDKKVKNSVMPFLAGSMQWGPSVLWSR